MRISVEGIRGSGKTTILKLLKLLKYKVHTANRGRENIWTSLYLQGGERFALGYNLNSFLEQTNVEYHNKEINLYENSPYTLQNIWSKVMLKKGHLTETEIQLQEEFVDKWGWTPECIIFLDCPPEVCLQRLEKNDQYGQPENLTALQELTHEYDWSLDRSNCDIPVYRVNADDHIINVFYHVVQILHQVRKHSLWFKNQTKPGNLNNIHRSGSLIDIIPMVEAIHNSDEENNIDEEDEIPLCQVNRRSTFNQILSNQNYIDELFQ